MFGSGIAGVLSSAGDRDIAVRPLYAQFLLLDGGIGRQDLGLKLIARAHVDEVRKSWLHHGDGGLVGHDLVADV